MLSAGHCSPSVSAFIRRPWQGHGLGTHRLQECVCPGLAPGCLSSRLTGPVSGDSPPPDAQRCPVSHLVGGTKELCRPSHEGTDPLREGCALMTQSPPEAPPPHPSLGVRVSSPWAGLDVRSAAVPGNPHSRSRGRVSPTAQLRSCSPERSGTCSGPSAGRWQAQSGATPTPVDDLPPRGGG